MHDEQMTQRQRQRKFHRRSRNGCSVCKQKHIRCDERKPLCTYCLRHGADCGYVDSPASADNDHEPEPSRRASPRAAYDASDYLSLIDTLPREPFAGTDIDVPYQSRPLFQLFMSTKVYYNTPVQRDPDSFVVHRALSHPGFMMSALLMTTLQLAWSTGDGEQFRIPYLYHKLQAMRFVKEQLANPGTAADEGTVAVIASLALVENSLGTMDAVAPHLRGLARIREIRERRGAPPTMGLLQRVILMAARSVSSRPIGDMLDISRTDHTHQSMIISLLRIALRPAYDMGTLCGTDDTTEPLSEILGKRSSHAEAGESNVVAPFRSVDSSRSGFMACYFYLYIILREERVDSFVLNWFLEQLVADVCRTEALMQKGQYSPSLWFWTVMFGACAASAARGVSPMEERQMQAVKDVYMAKIVTGNQELKIRTWAGAKSVLRLFAWEDGFDGEEELRALWEEATWGRYEERQSPGLQPSCAVAGLGSLIDPQLVGWC